MSPASTLELRAATAADAPRVREIARAAYGRYVERMGREPRPMVEDYSETIVRHDVTVAARDGAVVGYVVLIPDDAEGFLLDNVAVDPAHEDTGVGRALLGHAEACARAAGHDSIYLFTHELMTENQALYARIGYVEYDRRPHRGAQLVYLRKPLR